MRHERGGAFHAPHHSCLIPRASLSCCWIRWEDWLVSDRFPSAPPVGSAEAVARLRIDHDCVRIADLLGLCAKVIAHFLERRAQGIGNAAGLAEDLVRQ